MITVIIERHVAEGLETPYETAIGELLNAMTAAPGYISGESLVDSRQPNHYIAIARWATESAWNQWLHSKERKKMLTVIAPFLQTDEKFTLLKKSAYHRYL
ncbi:MAG: antibiotic biosynthesis monooxygenase family protein [Gammaproteobacteria bacterium]|jgi:antibiotic biosynthesis monooxygenase (ABM) superfamily enzyme